MLFGPKPEDTQGPRLSDLQVQSSTYGAPIPRVWGAMRLAGTVIWSSGLIESKHEEEIGGKGGPSATHTSYTYRASFAVLLCEGEIAGVRKIWANGKLIFDVGESADAETVLASYAQADAIRVYTGSETQEPDPTIEAYEGVGNVPAHRGSAYLLFDDLQLEAFGNRLPNITCEVVKAGSNAIVRTGNHAMPETTAEYSSSALRISDSDGASWLCIGDWDNGYASYGVSVYRAFPDGSAVLERTFEADANRPVSQGQSDVPAYIANDGWTGAWYYRIDRTPSGVRLRVPSTITGHKLNGYNLGRVFIRDGYVYGHTYGKGVLRWDVRSGLSEVYAIELIEFASQSLPGTVHDITVGESAIYGLVYSGSSYWLCTWDLNGALTDTTAFTPTGTLWTSHFGGGETELYSDAPGRVYLLESDGSLHKIEDGVYSYLGATGDSFGYEMAGGWAVRGQLLTTYSTDTNRLRTYHLSALTTSAATLSDVVGEILEQSGLSVSDYDVSALTDEVEGYAQTRVSSARQVIEPLQRAHWFDLIESDWGIKAVNRGGAAAKSLTEDDLGAHEYGTPTPPTLKQTRRDDLQLPRRVLVQYIDPANDYQQGQQYSGRLVAAGEAVEVVQLPMVLSADRAAEIADVLLVDAWTERTTYEDALTIEHFDLEPADVLDVTKDGAEHRLRITNLDVAFPALLKVRGVSEVAANYTSASVGASGPISTQSVALAGPTRLELLDIPALRDQDAYGWLYVAARGYLSGWRGAVLYKSTDDEATWGQVLGITRTATIGRVSNALGSADTARLDESNTLTVQLLGGTLSSVTKANLLNGSNWAAVGVHGRWEILGFQTATLNGDGTYTLSGLLRGQRGTEWAVDQHEAGDTFVLLTTSSLERLELGQAELDLERDYKAPAFGRPLQLATSEPFTWAGVCYTPLAVAHVRGSRDGSGNLTLSAAARGRIGSGFRVSQDDLTGYEVDVMNGSSVVRTITAEAGSSTDDRPAWTYSAADQTTDFGSPQSSVTVRIYALHELVGRGYAAEATV